MIKISSYITSRNVVQLDYPLKECVEQMLQYSDEVVIGDSSDIDDGTKDLLLDLEKSDKRVKVFHKDLDYNVPNFGIYDGYMKAFARSKTTGDWLVQSDSDEFFFDDSLSKIRQLCDQLHGQFNMNLVALPVVELWGSTANIRIDINPWKWRVSRNLANITHGIPKDLRRLENGLLYAKNGTDGCDYIDLYTGEPTPFVNFMDEATNQLRMIAIKDKRYTLYYENWIEDIITQLPSMLHLSWLSIERKIRTYRDYWNNHWKSLYFVEPNNKNPFFDAPWQEVTDEMIKSKAKELRIGTTGHIFHSKWNGERNNGIKLSKPLPSIAKQWIEKHLDD